MPQSDPLSFAERFVTWYEYERDCNAKTIKMLESVPVSKRSDASFSRAVGKAAHLALARQMWLNRLGAWKQTSGDFFAARAPLSSSSKIDWFPTVPLEELPAIFRTVEEQWTPYLARLTDEDLKKDFEYTGWDGKRRRWRLLDLLTQVFGHAWYHRGQIAMLVKDLGGEAIDTDFVFWSRPTIIEN